MYEQWLTVCGPPVSHSGILMVNCTLTKTCAAEMSPLSPLRQTLVSVGHCWLTEGSGLTYQSIGSGDKG